jgi:hypothetical protein
LEPNAAFALFNAYGIELLTASRLMAMYLGMSYRSIGLMNNGSSTGTLYVNNSGASYLISLTENIAKVPKELAIIDMKWRDLGRICVTCGTEVSLTSEIRRTTRGDIYCQSCHDKNFFRCAACEQSQPLELLYGEAELRQGDPMCFWCRTCQDNKRVITCDFCNKPRRILDTTQIHDGKKDKRRFCRWCRHKLGQCGNCGYWHELSRLSRRNVDDYLCCAACAEAKDGVKPL